MDDLFNVVPVKIYYRYLTEDNVEVADGNETLTATLSEESLVALRNALSTELDVVPDMAMLRMWYIGTTLHHYTYHITGGEDEDVKIEGGFVTEADIEAIKDELLQVLGLAEEIINTIFPYELPLILS